MDVQQNISDANKNILPTYVQEFIEDSIIIKIKTIVIVSIYINIILIKLDYLHNKHHLSKYICAVAPYIRYVENIHPECTNIYKLCSHGGWKINGPTYFQDVFLNGIVLGRKYGFIVNSVYMYLPYSFGL